MQRQFFIFFLPGGANAYPAYGSWLVLLINEFFAQRDIFLQRIQHAFHRVLLKRAQRADRLTLFNTVFTQQQRLREEEFVNK